MSSVSYTSPSSVHHITMTLTYFFPSGKNTSSGERLEVYATCFLMERKTFPVSDFIGLSGCVFFSYESSESPGESNQPDRIFWGPGWQCDSYL